MDLDPFTISAGKAILTAGAKPSIAQLRLQLARRGAEYADVATLGTADREMDEAIAVLRGASETIPAAIAAKLKGLLSGRPDSFAGEDAKRFIEDDRIVALVKSGTRKTLLDGAIDQELAEARAIHAELFGEEGIYGETLLEDAIRFAALTLFGHLTRSDRVMLDLQGARHDELLDGLQAISGKIDEIQISAGSPAVDAEVLDQAVLGEVRKLKRRRFVAVDESIDKARQLGSRLGHGLQQASPGVRATACREIGATLARSGHPDEAETWIKKAEELGADATCERARLAMARDRPGDAMLLLRDRPDALSKSLLIDAIQKRDGEAKALEFFEDNLQPGELTGHALQAMGGRLTQAARVADAVALLASATAEQIDENPLILFLRARLRMSGALPADVAARFIHTDGLFPHPGDVRDDDEGQERLKAARADLILLKEQLGDLDAPDLSSLTDVNLLAIDLNHGDADDRRRAREALAKRLDDPREAMELAPIAALYRVELDWAAIRARLAHAEQLGGYDDIQLRAAFALKMRGDSHQEIFDFISAYRDRLKDVQGAETVIGLEVEARARLGDLDGSKALLTQERANLSDKAQVFLDSVIAEAAGEDSISVRLAQFEASQATHDLVLLVGALDQHGDVRLGEYLVQLWRQRHQVEDARRACDALVRAGKTAEAEAFLEEIGDLSRQDPFLHTHLAWARQRQGRLLDAIDELAALGAAGVDDANTRRLAILVAVETGRWAELEPMVQKELAKQVDRSAAQLMAAAHVAQAIDSQTAMPLARAAIAKRPDDPSLNMNGYTIAVNAGFERSAEVGGWFGTAMANSTPEGPIFSKDFEEVIEIVKDSRAQSERVNELVNTAQVPIFIAFGRSRGAQSAMILLSMAENADQTDSRRRTVLPLYAGNRSPTFDQDISTVGFEPLAILVLYQLGLLEQAIQAFDTVVLPAGTLNSFFEDRKNVAHSQPSRIAQAREIKDKMGSGTLAVEDLPAGDSALVSQVGEEFARLFKAAEAREGYVVDTAPIHPPGNLREVVDPAPFAARLLSPAGLVESLLGLGTLSAARAGQARSAVAGGGGSWTDEIVPEQAKTLFLTNLAVQYLNDAGLLTMLKAHAGALIVLPEVASLADREIAAGEAGAKVRQGIDQIREILSDAITNGRARVGPMRLRSDEMASSENDDEDGDEDGEDEDRATDRDMMGPILNALRDAGGMDALVCDDRAMNKYLEFTDRTGRKVPFLTTPDLLVMLHKKGVINETDLAAARESLRNGGAGLMPLDPHELVNAALSSNWAIGPNADLRAIRDSIHLPLARKVIQLPQERVWFKAMCIAIAFTIRRVWQEVEDPVHAARAASWLHDMIPDAAAASAMDESPDREFWLQDVTRHTLWAIASIFALPEGRSEPYQQWFAGVIAPSVERRDPGAIEAMAKTLTAFLTRPASDEASNGE